MTSDISSQLETTRQERITNHEAIKNGNKVSHGGTKREKISVWTPDHQNAVKDVINRHLQATIEKYTVDGQVTETRYNIMVKSLKAIVDEREEDPSVPGGTLNLVWRDADHYLAARIGELANKLPGKPSPVDYEGIYTLSYPAFLIYDNPYKYVGEWWETMTGKSFVAESPLHPPANRGGMEWAVLGYHHYLRYDRGRLKHLETPELVEEVPQKPKDPYPEGLPWIMGP